MTARIALAVLIVITFLVGAWHQEANSACSVLHAKYDAAYDVALSAKTDSAFASAKADVDALNRTITLTCVK